MGMVLVGLIVLLMKPVNVSETTETSKEGIDIVLTLDVSGSMGADDFKPDRLSVARETLESFVQELESDRVGLVVFAGKPFTSVPLTFDYEITKQIIAKTSIDMINQNVRGLNGTAIGDAMLSSLQILEKWTENEEQITNNNNRKDKKKGRDREQVMILVTDGAATQGTFNPLGAAAYAIEQWVTVYTVGIGSLKWGSIPFQTAFGVRRQAVWWVDEKMLKNIADTTGGKYRRATDGETFQRIFDELSELTKSEVKTETVQSASPALAWLERVVIGSIVILLLLHLVLQYRQSRSTDDRRIQSIILLVVFVLSLVLLPLVPIWEELDAQREVSVVLDVSKSMQVQDIAYRDIQVSRLQVAKTLVQRAVDTIGDAKRGMQVFAGASTTVLPVTADRELFLTFLQWVDRESVLEWWSDLGQAVRQAVDRFIDPSETTERMVLVVSDGWEEEVTLDDQTLLTLEENNISLLVIGVGTQQWWPIVEGIDRSGNPVVTQYQGETVIAGLWEEILKSIAAQGWWTYEQVDDVDDISKILKDLMSDEALLGWGWVWWGWYEIVLLLMVLLSVFPLLRKYMLRS